MLASPEEAMTETASDLDTSWMEQGACLNEDPEIFFLDNDDPEELRKQKMEAARGICMSCPVLAECTLHGLLVETDDHWNIYGGMTHRERRALRREIGWK